MAVVVSLCVRGCTHVFYAYLLSLFLNYFFRENEYATVPYFLL